MKKRRDQPKRRQPTPIELRDAILDFIRRKFYPEQFVAFEKDKPQLLKLVVLRLALYLDDRGVSISPARYQEIMIGGEKVKGILMDALIFGNTGNITYLPAWLGKTVESHLDHQGEKYYEEGKSLRNAVDQALTIAKNSVREPDATRQLADAARLLKGRKKTAQKQTVTQPELLLPGL